MELRYKTLIGLTLKNQKVQITNDRKNHTIKTTVSDIFSVTTRSTLDAIVIDEVAFVDFFGYIILCDDSRLVVQAYAPKDTMDSIEAWFVCMPAHVK